MAFCVLTKGYPLNIIKLWHWDTTWWYQHHTHTPCIIPNRFMWVKQYHNHHGFILPFHLGFLRQKRRGWRIFEAFSSKPWSLGWRSSTLRAVIYGDSWWTNMNFTMLYIYNISVLLNVIDIGYSNLWQISWRRWHTGFWVSTKRDNPRWLERTNLGWGSWPEFAMNHHAVDQNHHRSP